MNLLKLAEDIARAAHKGQTDKAGKDYFLHPLAVSWLVTSEAEKITALLHDVVEDSDTTLEDLKKQGFPYYIINAVDLLTKKEGQSLDSYFGQLVKNDIAYNVKIADMTHNSDIGRFDSIGEKEKSNQAKYLERIELLKSMRHVFAEEQKRILDMYSFYGYPDADEKNKG